MAKDFLKDENLLAMAKHAKEDFNPLITSRAEQQIVGYMEDACIPFNKVTLKAFLGGLLFLKGVERKLETDPMLKVLGAIKGREMNGMDIVAFSSALLMAWLVRLEGTPESPSGDKLNTTTL